VVGKDDIIELHTNKPLTPAEALAVAGRADLETVIVFGMGDDGRLHWFNSSMTFADFVYFCDVAKHEALKQVLDD
jgi:hypothetical protein